MKHSLLKKVFIIGACFLLSGSLLVGCGSTKTASGSAQTKGSQGAPPQGKKPTDTPPKGKRPTGTPPKGAPKKGAPKTNSTQNSSSSSN